MSGEHQIWGQVELEPEVALWLQSRSEAERHHIAFYVDLLEENGAQLRYPHTSQLRGKLRELRFYLGRERWRIAYFIAPHRRIILLTVFKKTKQQERAEVERAVRAMESWTG